MNMRPLDERSAEEVERMPTLDRIRRLENNDRTTIVERRRIVELQRSQLWGVVAVVVLLFVVAGLLVKGIAHNANHANDAAQKARATGRSLRSYEIRSCERANERTAADNVSQAADYRFFKVTSTLIRASLTTPQPGQVQTAKQRAATFKFVKGLEADAADKVWHPLIADCEAAVDNPAYRLPDAVHFTARYPFPAALKAPRPGAARKATPPARTTAPIAPSRHRPAGNRTLPPSPTPKATVNPPPHHAAPAPTRATPTTTTTPASAPAPPATPAPAPPSAPAPAPPAPPPVLPPTCVQALGVTACLHADGR